MIDSFAIATTASFISPDVREAGAPMIHFPEGALSGYAEAQILDWAGVDWSALRAELDGIAALAGQLGLWTVIGCNHRLTPPNRPHNSLYVISGKGVLVGRYDKRLCSHTETNDWYTPGVDPLVFEVDGFRFGAALCIEIHFPTLFAEYEKQGVDCVLFSAYAENPMFGLLAQAHAETNNYWVSLATPAQCGDQLPSGLIGPDGYFAARDSASANPAILHSAMDRRDPLYEIALTKARPWRTAARKGDIYRARQIDDARGRDHTSFFVP